MAKKKQNEVMVGITVVVVLVLAFYIVVAMADWQGLSKSKQKITVQLPYKVGLRGLMAGSPIYLGGAKIGQITETHIEKLEPTETTCEDINVFFTMKIPQEYPLRRDCVLVPKSNVLGGQTVLIIEDMGLEGAVIRNDETVELNLGESLAEVIKREFDPENPESLMGRLKYEVDRTRSDSIVASLAQTTANLKDITTNIDHTVQVNRDSISQLIQNITEVSVNLKLASREIRRAPWKLLYKPGKKELKIQGLISSAGAFAAGAEHLDSASMRLQTILAASGDGSQIDREKIDVIVSELQSSFNQYRKVEKKFWDELP